MSEKKKKLAIVFILVLLSAFISGLLIPVSEKILIASTVITVNTDDKIKWVDFDIPYAVLKKAMDADIESANEQHHIDWIDCLAYLAAKYGGDFSKYKDTDMDYFISEIKKGHPVKKYTEGLKYFNYYHEAYEAVLGGFLGNEGLKAFFPLPEGYYYSDFDDFGENRSYGYSRRHLGHDMMTSVGTPVIAIEGGTVEALGWNQYGGWRIGIRSFDAKRYYYYAHLRKDSPYAEDIHVGKKISAGEIIGYTGQTGYSIKENVNNINEPHLHIGMQLVFDEDAKESPTQIWIDLYDIIQLLSANKRDLSSNTNASVNASNSKEKHIPIIMYHSLLNNPAGKSKYVVSPKQFEEDLKFIKTNGYTTVTISNLISYVNNKENLPQNPIILTFDDGYYNNYYYAHPLLEKYNMKAVISIVGKMTDDFSVHPDENPSYAHVTWDNILDMHLSGHWEIQNHSYNCHTYENRNGICKLPEETEEEYNEFLKSDLMKLQNKIAYVTGVTPTTLTYPFGAFSKETDSVLKDLDFKATLGCTEGMSVIKKGDPQSLYQLKRFLRPPNISSEEFFSYMKDSIKQDD